MRKTLTVTVSGESASGKSSLIYLLKKMLKLNQFETSFDGGIDFKNETEFDNVMGDAFRHALNKNPIIKIKEVNTRPDPDTLYSLYEYLGYKAGKLGGRMVNNIARQDNIDLTTKSVIGESYQGEVMTYPLHFLDKLSKKGKI